MRENTAVMLEDPNVVDTEVYYYNTETTDWGGPVEGVEDQTIRAIIVWAKMSDVYTIEEKFEIDFCNKEVDFF